MRIRLIALVILATYPFLMAIAEENICDSIRQDSIIMRKAQIASATENTEAQTPQITPPSPTVQALCRYGETPVSYATGIPNIAIPLYTIKCGSLELPITLTYHAGGIKVDDTASWVGLGWSLNAGGVIGITTVGHHDVYVVRNDTLPSHNDIDDEHFDGIDTQILYTAYETCCKDYQPDIVSYNFLGHNGQIIYDGNSRKWYNFSGDKSVKFTSSQYDVVFSAVDNKGNRFTLDAEEGTYAGGLNYMPSAYHLSKFVSFDSMDSIQLSYTRSVEHDRIKVMSNLVYGANGNKVWEKRMILNGTNKIGGGEGFQFLSDKYYTHITQKLSKIKASNGTTIEFVHIEDREDILTLGSSEEPPVRLSQINIYNAQGNRIKRWDFIYDYFIAHTKSSYCSAHDKRLKLVSLKEYGSTDAEPRVYKFNYYGDDEGEPTMPHRNAFSGKDAWGYCNGMPTQKDANDSMMSYPNFKDVEFCLYRKPGNTVISNENLTVSYNKGRNVDANPSYIHAYSLKQITFPSGGHEQFIYEPNHYSTVDRFKNQQGNPESISCYGGGLRIKLIISNYGETESTRSFEYSEGDVPRHPHFLKRRFYEERSQKDDPLRRQNSIDTYLQLCPNAVNTSYVAQGNNVMYPQVREIFDDGYVEYNHTMLEDTNYSDLYSENDDDMYSGFAHFIGSNATDCAYQVVNGCVYNTWSNTNIQNIDNNSDYMGYNGAFFRRGQLESKKYYDKNGRILKEEDYSYTTKEMKQVSGMEVRRETGMDTFITSGSLAGTRKEFYYYSIYWLAVGNSLLTNKDITTHFYKNGEHTSNTIRHKYTYTSDNLLSSETITDNVGKTVMTKIIYPSDINAAPYTEMKKSYMLDYPVEQTVCRGGNVAQSVLTEYAKFGSSYYPKSSYTYKPVTINSNFTQYNGIRASHYTIPNWIIDAYDHGRITRMQTKDYLKHSFAWGYNHEYPTLEIIDDCYHSTNDPDTWADAQVHNFEYTPQIGVTSEIAPNGLKLYYGYDAMGRLANKRFSTLGTVQEFATERYHYNESGSGNYITSETLLDEAGNYKKTEMAYYDGLNRPVETVTNGLNVAGNYTAAYTEYDDRGRARKTWLPVVCGMTHDFVPSSSLESLAQSTYSDSHAYSLKAYDILDRPVKELMPGEAWHSGNKGVAYEYLTNAPNSVKRYDAPCDKISLVKNGYYPPNTLSSVKTTDADGHTLEIFSDFEGRKILERRNGDNDTYFVYNVLGQLRNVLTPQYQAEEKKALYAYEYRYDDRGNVVKKILPGCEPTKYLYDSHDRLIAMHDGRMNESSYPRHEFYVYDKFGRLAVQGRCSGVAHPGDNLAILDVTAAHDKTKDLGGYTIEHPYNYNSPKAELVNYYDSYDFVDYCGALKKLPTDSLKQKLIQAPILETLGIDYGKGRKTGQFMVDSDGHYTLTTFFYDIRGNVIASRSVSSDKTYTSIRNDYTFTNTVKRASQTVIKDFGTAFAHEYMTELVNTYDEQSGKLLYADLTVTDGNSSKTQRISSYEYDNLGRISTMEQGAGAHNTSYSYDLHGWTTSITGDAFTENLGYATGANPCYNGSISSMEWKNANDQLTRKYDFTYDGLNRLANAVYDDANGNKNHYDEFVTYNRNGSPLMIKRNGKNDSGLYKTIDNLSLQYTGNRLKKVTDKGESCTANGATDFNDGADELTEYTYDACGSLTSDANKGIAKISYNYWGTPKLIQFTNGSQTEYIYDANGTKLRRIHRTAVDNIVVPINTTVKLSENQTLTSDTTEYIGDLIFENGILDKILFSGGYISCNNNITFHYYAKDHLGNNRAVVSENGAIEQTTNYYPFGNSFADATTNPSLQPYKYNDKELDRMHGLDWYDYGARNYDPVLYQWTSVDPLCEKYYNVSPYTYCLNNPVSNIDTDGRKVKPSGNEELIMIRNTLPKHDRRFVVLDNNGYIDAKVLNNHTSSSHNYNSLSILANSNYDINVNLDDKYTYRDNEGQILHNTMGYGEADPYFVDSDFKYINGLTTGETGLFGISLLPGKGHSGVNSIDDSKIFIVVNKNLSDVGRAESFSHEGYGHAKIYVETEDREKSRHITNDGMETNALLREEILKVRKETILNLFFNK